MISNIAGGYSSNFDFDKPEIGSEITRSANWIHAMTTIYQRVIKLVIFTINFLSCCWSTIDDLSTSRYNTTS